MSLEVNKIEVSYELFPIDSSSNIGALPIRKKRVLVGRGQACDIVLPYPNISSIHAVLEFKADGSFKVYDMNSTNGTYVSGKPVVAENIRSGEQVQFASHVFEIRPLLREDLLPPPLEMLDPVQVMPSQQTVTKPLPRRMPEEVANKRYDSPQIVYPLAKDSKADFSDYIFEDADSLYPIFKYDFSKTAAEVIILHRDRICSVDYIPDGDGTYFLVGSNPNSNDIEYPYLGLNDKQPIIEIRGKEIFAFPLPNYDFYSFSKENMIQPEGSFFVGQDEIVRMRNNDIQIFVRSTEAPPKVAAAPVFGRDKGLRKYLLLMLLLVFTFLGTLSLFEVDEEIEKEKAPERIATILYKKQLVLSNTPAIAKTKKAPKRVQKSPQKKEIQKQKKEQSNKVKTPNKKVVKAKRGSKNAKKVGKVKKASPNKGPTVKKDKVRPVTKTKTSSSSKASAASARKSRNASKAKGTVQTYKSADFKSSLSSLLKRGGSLSKVKSANSGSVGAVGESKLSGSESGAQAEMAKVSNNIGRLSGAASGTLDQTKGTDGLFDKGSIYTAGLPYKTVVLGGLDPDVIRQILIANIPQFRGCYQSEINRQNRAFDGRVKLTFSIGASGHVSSASVDSMSSLPGVVKNCVVNVLKGIRFPKPLGGTRVEVKQPFNFYPRIK